MKTFYFVFILALTSVFFAGCIGNGTIAEPPSNVIIKEYGDVRLHTFLSDSVSPVIVEKNRLVMIDYPGDSAEQAAAFKEYAESLGKPVDRIIISHIDEAHWTGVEEYFPNVPLYSVDADEIMSTENGANLTVIRLNDNAKETIDGGSYEFETNREIGAWVVKLPDQKAVYVEHLGYVNLHILLVPLEPRLEILQTLEAEGYTWFMPGHGMPMTAPEFVDTVERYYGDVLQAVSESETPEEAKAIIMAKYPDYYSEGLLDALFPQFFN